MTYRDDALFRAKQAYGDHVAVLLATAKPEIDVPAAWHHLDFRNRHMLDVWLRDTAGLPERFVYAAAFDKTTPEWTAGRPIGELTGAGTTGDRPIVGTDPGYVDVALTRAARIAAGSVARFVGVVLTSTDPMPAWSSTPARTLQELIDWFALWTAAAPETYVYVAAFDKRDAGWQWGRPIAEHRSAAGYRTAVGLRQILTAPEAARLAESTPQIVRHEGGGDYGASWGLDWSPSVHVVGRHGTEDKERVIRQIGTYLRQVVAELYRKMGGDPASVLATPRQVIDPAWRHRHEISEATVRLSPLYPLWRDVVSPTWDDWLSFVSWYDGLYVDLSSWDRWAGWIERVGKLHAYLASEVPKYASNEQLTTPAPFVGRSHVAPAQERGHYR
jgi:hypothetical protein